VEGGNPKTGWREVSIKMTPKPQTADMGVMNTAGKIYSAGMAVDIAEVTQWQNNAYGAR